MSNRFYITTAIDYPNGNPHLGHAYEKIVTDFYARWYRMTGKDVYFLTGTDENGQKLVKSAKETGKEAKEFVDENVKVFRKLCEVLNISHDDFIRTTEERHHKVAQKLWKTLEKAGDIYFGKYSGHYCFDCEAFYTKSQVEDDLNCPSHKKPLEFIEEEGYFFKLSKYQDWIVKHIKSHESFIIPKASRNEILSRLQGEDLRDLSISRPNAGWGVPVPSNDKHVMYTWFDALINYYTGVIIDDKTKDFWPAQMHVIGKDITWFHTVIWPCMLHAAKIEIPEQVYVHGMILAEDGSKMSKSLGNCVSPDDVMSQFKADSFRYYLLRHISSAHDGKFSLSDMKEKQNAELANDFGNLLMRVTKLAIKKLGNEITPDGVKKDLDLGDLFKKMSTFVDHREHHRALDEIWHSINHVNAYINEKAPWKVKEDPVALKQILYNAMDALYYFGILLRPFIPETADKTLEYLGAKLTSPTDFQFGTWKYKLTSPEPLFPKLD